MKQPKYTITSQGAVDAVEEHLTQQPPSEIALLAEELRQAREDAAFLRRTKEQEDRWHRDEMATLKRLAEDAINSLSAIQTKQREAIAAIQGHIASEEGVKFAAQEAARIATYPKDAAAAKYGEAIADAKIEAYSKSLRLLEGK